MPIHYDPEQELEEPVTSADIESNWGDTTEEGGDDGMDEGEDTIQPPQSVFSSTPPPPPSPSPREESMGKLGDFQGKAIADRNDREGGIQGLIKGGGTLSWGPKGISATNLPPEFVQGLLSSQKQLNEITGSFAQESERLKAQRAALETTGGKIGNALSVFSGHLAQDPRMPPWVRAMGATARDLNPTREQLSARQMAVDKERASMAEAQMRISETALRADAANQFKMLQHERLSRSDYEKAVKQYTSGFEAEAKKGTDPPPLDKFAEDMAQRVPGLTPQDAIAEHRRLSALASDAHEEQKRRDKEQQATKVETATLVAKALAPIKGKATEDRIAAQKKATEELIDYRSSKIEKRQQEVADYNANLKATQPLRALSGKQEETLQKMVSTSSYIEALEGIVNDPEKSKNFGPLNLKRITGEWSKVFRSEDLQEVMTYMAHELPRVADFTGAQSRAFTAAMVPVVKSLGGETSMTVPQLKAVLKVMKESVDQVRTGIAVNKPYFPFDKSPGSLGGPMSGAYKAWEKAKEAGAPKATRPVTNDELKQAKAAKVGSMVPLGGINYIKKGENEFDPAPPVGSR